MTGFTNSTDFPTTFGAFQTTYTGGGNENAFVTKLNPTGTALVYSTYLASSSSSGTAIAVDATGHAHVTGRASFSFPTSFEAFQPTPAGGGDAFVTKLNPTGTALVYSTYLGGSNIDGGYSIAVDTTGNAYVTGYTFSTNFPTTLGAFQTALTGAGDAFVTKLSPMGIALVYSTYLGGSGNSTDVGLGIAVDATDHTYVTGLTHSTDFATTPGAFQTTFAGGSEDAFVTKLTPTGTALVYSTYLGASDDERGYSIAVDTTGNAYVTGYTASSNFPTANPLQATLTGSEDAFVTKLTPTGTALVYSTCLGGNSYTHGYSIAVDATGNAYVTGQTGSFNFPTTTGAFQTTAGSQDRPDAFLAKISDVPPNQNPTCSAAVANPNTLWQPDGRMVPIAVTGVTDPDGNSVTITVTTVTQDEPVISKGDKKLTPDAVIQAGSVSVRAERLDKGNGRVYQISFRADDGKGGSCIGSVKVGVPLNLNKGLIPIDDGQLYDSTIP